MSNIVVGDRVRVINNSTDRDKEGIIVSVTGILYGVALDGYVLSSFFYTTELEKLVNWQPYIPQSLNFGTTDYDSYTLTIGSSWETKMNSFSKKCECGTTKTYGETAQIGLHSNLCPMGRK